MGIRNILSQVFSLMLIFGSIANVRSQESPKGPYIFKKEIVSCFRGLVPRHWVENVP